MIFVGEKNYRQKSHKNFSGKFGKFGQKSSEPTKICLLLHLYRERKACHICKKSHFVKVCRSKQSGVEHSLAKNSPSS